jgi:hypothetical protein
MSIKTDIKSTVSLGGGIGSYIAYKIDVTQSGEGGNKSWAVFRRFKDFTAFHERLLGNYTKEVLEAAGVVLPEHTLGIGKTLSHVIKKRMQGLQEYLEKMLTLEEIYTHNFVTGFFDMTNNGKSGAIKELGAKSVLIENFGYCKPCTKIVEFWHSVYLVLTKAGTLYVFKNYDDGIFQAFINFPIAGRDIHVEARAGSRNIEMICEATAPNRVIINLNSDMEVASWLRAIADFGTKGGAGAAFVRQSGSSPASTPAKGATNGAPMQASGPEIHARGTGHTADELSAMYGV